MEYALNRTRYHRCRLGLCTEPYKGQTQLFAPSDESINKGMMLQSVGLSYLALCAITVYRVAESFLTDRHQHFHRHTSFLLSAFLIHRSKRHSRDGTTFTPLKQRLYLLARGNAFSLTEAEIHPLFLLLSLEEVAYLSRH